jgi:ligand-binding sensor domain-containing protein
MLSQSNLIIGEWKSHLSYRSGIRLTQSPNKVIYASQRGIFMVDKDDLSVSTLSKENGLSDIKVSNLFYDPFNEQIIVIYDDSNIDVVHADGSVSNLPFIQSNTSILGGKTINQVFFQNKNSAYIATDFGVIGFNPEKLEFPFTTFTSFPILSIAILNDFVYVGTENGVYNLKLTGTNISDFNQWSKMNSSGVFFEGTKIDALVTKHNQLFVVADNQIFAYTQQFKLVYKPSDAEENIKFLSDSGPDLIVGITKGNNAKAIFINKDNQVTEGRYGCPNLFQYAVEDQKGRIWIADQWDPIKYLQNRLESNCSNVNIPSPFSNEGSSIRFKKDKAYIASNGVTEDFQYSFTRNGYYTLENNTWENFNSENFKILVDQDFFHLMTLAPNPKKKEVYLGSYYNGLIFYDEEADTTAHWNKDNSVLQRTEGDEARTRVSGLAFDKDGNLWISNYLAKKPIVVKTKDNTWHSFSVPGATLLHEISIDQKGNKWIPVYGTGNGLVVYYEGSNIADPTDDKVKYITRNNSVITGNKVNCATVDLDGSIWVGTDEGPVVFDCGDPFAATCTGNTRKVVVDGIPAPLLRYEDIISIGIDGANRKWFGTRNGIFVQSSDGVTAIDRFDIKNSPLLDNRVDELSFNAETGEMFIVTRGGIQSVKTNTTGGGNSFSSNVYAYPNPVTPGYTGPIAIKGLMRDSNVKITDLNGRLVYETKALGGQAIWDGNDYNGVRASTGVYLVFSANENTSLSPDAVVTKILLVD